MDAYGWGRLLLFFYLSGQVDEGLVHVLAAFRANLEELHVIFFSQGVALFVGDLSFLLKVVFGSE